MYTLVFYFKSKVIYTLVFHICFRSNTEKYGNALRCLVPTVWSTRRICAQQAVRVKLGLQNSILNKC